MTHEHYSDNPEIQAILEAMCDRVDAWEKEQNERIKRELDERAKEQAVIWHKNLQEKAKKSLQSSH
jgi:TRAP-type C4-dicarboxylate transport system substrate-binding protein